MTHESHVCTCGSGGAGGCGSSANDEPMPMAASAPIARINGIALHKELEHPDAETVRQRACTELLRQRAQSTGLLAADDVHTADGAISVAAAQAIEQLLERELSIPEPTEDACRRYHAAHPFAHDERVRLRHVLFAVTPGVDVRALRLRAEAMLLELRAADASEQGKFAESARTLSNCPSGQQGGELGWLSRADCAPEFAREIFASAEVGVLSRLVHSRFGLHVVEVLERDAGHVASFDASREHVQRALHQQAWVNALRHYLQVLAGEAHMEGVDLDAAQSPLMQ